MSFGMFASNSNALLVLESNNLGSSALGLLFCI